jgi:hypothetical protein
MENLNKNYYADGKNLFFFAVLTRKNLINKRCQKQDRFKRPRLQTSFFY